MNDHQQNLDDLAQSQWRMLRLSQQGSAPCDLGGLDFEIRTHIEVQLVDEFAGDLPRRDQFEQSVVHPELESLLQLALGLPAIGRAHQVAHSGLERAVAGEECALAAPEPVGIELGDVGQGVEAAGVVATGEATDRGQVAHEAAPGARREGAAECGHVEDAVATEESGQRFGGWAWHGAPLVI